MSHEPHMTGRSGSPPTQKPPGNEPTTGGPGPVAATETGKGAAERLVVCRDGHLAVEHPVPDRHEVVGIDRFRSREGCQ